MDRMQATPRSAIGGLLADAMFGGLNYMKDPRRTQQMQGLAAMLESTGVPAVVDRMSYGEPLTTGSGMTTQMRPETENTLMAALSMIPVGKPAQAGAMALGRAGERVAERMVPQVMSRGGLPAEMLSAMAQGTQSPATVFHGSPHRFTKFDSSKIGTGEGNQTYGYGLYLAENPAVAQEYKQALSEPELFVGGKKLQPKAGSPDDVANAWLQDVFDRGFFGSKTADPFDQAIADIQKAPVPDKEAVIQAVKDLKAKGATMRPGGNVYQVDLPDEQIAKMLDFDSPFNKQPKSVQEAIKASGIFKEYKANLSDFSSPMMSRNKNMRGENIMQFLEFKLGGPEQVAAKLRDLGISGVRYLDEGSRGAGKGTSNFVVFPGMEDMLRIEQINEQPINSLLQTLGR
jgi:hypothetical protein